jgi:hypothetical protein
MSVLITNKHWPKQELHRQTTVDMIDDCIRILNTDKNWRFLQSKYLQCVSSLQVFAQVNQRKSKLN